MTPQTLGSAIDAEEKDTLENSATQTSTAISANFILTTHQCVHLTQIS